MIIFLVIFLILLLIAFFFSSKVSEIPYFPTNHKDLPIILKELDLKNDQVVFDLGAGDGTVIFAVASEALKKNLNTQFVAIDINPVLVGWMWIRRLFHPNRANITLITADLFTFDYAKITNEYKHVVFYMYISPWLIEKIVKIIKKLQGNIRVVSYFYPVASEKEMKKVKGIHTTFVYEV